MKKILPFILAALFLLSAVSCNTTPDVTTDNTTEPGTEIITEKETEEVTGTETEAITDEPIIDEDPVFYEKTDRAPIDPASADLSGTDWDGTIVNANERANGVSGTFTDAERKQFLIKNQTSSLLYDLQTNGNKQVAALYNAEGKPYFTNTMDAYILNADGVKYSSAYSMSNGRMNSNRIGYYYYDFRFRDQDFIDPESLNDTDYYDIIAKGSKWSGNDVKGLSKKGGVLKFEVTSSIDPYVLTSVSYPADNYDSVQITIKADVSTVAYLYIIAGSRSEFNQDQMTNFKFVAGKWTTVVVPLSSVADFTGLVKGFRIDCGVQSGEKVEIKEIRAVNRSKSTVPLAFEHIFHTYSDKMHEVVRAVATADYEGGGRFETQVVIPADTVRKFVIKNAAGEVSSLDGFDFSTTEYVGFDIKNAGIFGIIMPAAENNGDVKVELSGGNYIITRGMDVQGTVKKGKDILFGHRLYTSVSHQFNDLRKEAYTERNPLTDIYIVKKVDDAEFKGYDALTGSYVFTVRAMEFSTAFHSQPNKQFNVNALICGDGVVDRKIYVQTAENSKTRRGRLECAAILDEKNRVLPLPLEVGKNFDGENEEPLYYPEYGTGAAAFGEVYVPVTVGKDENKQFTMLHLYQNWGNYPLKQISFIAFHIPYYHLSVGVTETNCITPYYVQGKDGWMLPDFRANSAPFWDGGRGTQHTSIGKLFFLQYKDADGNVNKAEIQNSDIVSSGPVYADINMHYMSDDGKIKATYRHAEMAQTDETRTYYTVKYEVLDDINIADFKNDFSIFSFDSFTVGFSKVGYLDENGKNVVENVKQTERFIKLGAEYPYFDFYGGNVKDSVNFALIIRDSDITVGGKKYDGRFLIKEKFDGTVNLASLSLDLGETTLKKGDVIELNMILLPWGYSTSTSDKNVTDVRQDSCISPFKVTVIEGEEHTDDYIPSLRAVNNSAKFRISGGASTAAVRIYGFTDYTLPEITFKADGKDADITLAGKNGYDGYQVNRDDDGTYSFSFNVNMNNAAEYEITVKQ